jgi:hypothetical protein
VSNGAPARPRADQWRGLSFEQVIPLVADDVDELERVWSDRLARMESNLRRISAACIGILTLLVGSLILLVVQLGGAK